MENHLSLDFLDRSVRLASSSLARHVGMRVDPWVRFLLLDDLLRVALGGTVVAAPSLNMLVLDEFFFLFNHVEVWQEDSSSWDQFSTFRVRFCA